MLHDDVLAPPAHRTLSSRTSRAARWRSSTGEFAARRCCWGIRGAAAAAAAACLRGAATSLPHLSSISHLSRRSNFNGFGKEIFTDAGKYVIHFGSSPTEAAEQLATAIKVRRRGWPGSAWGALACPLKGAQQRMHSSGAPNGWPAPFLTAGCAPRQAAAAGDGAGARPHRRVCDPH